MSRNECFFPGSNVTCFTFLSICDLFTDSPSYILTHSKPIASSSSENSLRLPFNAKNLFKPTCDSQLMKTLFEEDVTDWMLIASYIIVQNYKYQ
jgi:hypothetical protein